MLYLIGTGLNDEKDISLKGLEAIKKSKFVYLETYTSKLNCSVSKLEKLYKKKIILADRNLVENSNEIIDKAKEFNVAFLIIGDVFSATTHINFILECKKQKVEYKIIHNASVINAIGDIGLEIYKFGKTTSVPFDNENVKTPIEAINQNLKNDFHTLVLLDLDPSKNRFMTINEALQYLLKNGISDKQLVIVCSQMGGNPEIMAGEIKEFINMKFTKFPQSIVVPSNKLHFVEEACIKLWMS